jgi:hypothetical protein
VGPGGEGASGREVLMFDAEAKRLHLGDGWLLQESSPRHGQRLPDRSRVTHCPNHARCYRHGRLVGL